MFCSSQNHHSVRTSASREPEPLCSTNSPPMSRYLLENCRCQTKLLLYACLQEQNLINVLLNAFSGFRQNPSADSYLKMLSADLQPVAHIQEVRNTWSVQQDVDGHRAARGCVHQVLQDMWICDHVHDNCDELQREPGRG